MKSGNKIRLHPLVIRDDIPRLDINLRKRIHDAIKIKLTTNPDIFGTPLRGTLKHRWKLRVGNYRVVYSIRNAEVYILMVGHRSEIYKLAEQRL